MLKTSKIVALAVAATAMALGSVSSASAMHSDQTVTKKYYTQSAGGISCHGNVSGQNGGMLSVRIFGYEQRPAGQHMETADLYTRLFAQRWVDGQWRTVRIGQTFFGMHGDAHNAGHGMLQMPFIWPGYAPSQYSPRFHIHVDNDGLYRLLAVTKDYDNDHLLVAKLPTFANGTCQIG